MSTKEAIFKVGENIVCIDEENKPYEARVEKIRSFSGVLKYVIHYKNYNKRHNVNIPIGEEEGRMFKGTLEEYFSRHEPPTVETLVSVKREIVEREEEQTSGDDQKEMLKKILEKLTAAEESNRLLEQRIANMEHATPNSTFLTVAEETLRANCHYLKESSSIIDQQHKEIEERKKELRNCEGKAMAILGVVQRDLGAFHENQKRIAQNNLQLNRMIQTPPPQRNMALPSNPRLAIMPVNPSAKCLFCDVVGHVSVHCQRYPTAMQRRYRLDELNICIRCLQPNKNTTGSEDRHDPCPSADVACVDCSLLFGGLRSATHHHPVACVRNQLSQETQLKLATPRRLTRQTAAAIRNTPY